MGSRAARPNATTRQSPITASTETGSRWLNSSSSFSVSGNLNPPEHADEGLFSL
jgi:hypothetical protein